MVRKKNRLSEYDYSENGYYFVTICSLNKQDIFGQQTTNVGEGLASSRNSIKLSSLGKIIDKQLTQIPEQFNAVELDHYIIMPDHIHAILIIDNCLDWADARPAPTISEIVCSFKSKCSVDYLSYIKNNNLDVSGKIWQRSFYDHVIRSEKSLDAIREYIQYNPDKLEEDFDSLINL
jgi:REP element-mobilizing transposase RayT